MPRYAIQFVNRPYSSHQYFKGAFRHEIEIPNDIFPTAWLDLANDDPQDTITTTTEIHSHPKHNDFNNEIQLNDMENVDAMCWIPEEILLNNNADMKEGPYGDEKIWHETDSERQQMSCTILYKQLEFPELVYSMMPSQSVYTVKVNDSGKSVLIGKIPHFAIDFTEKELKD
uniref:Uncharacterized protein n=1 Tax=Eucampia antarctica TaxID=49252 RepID=A0A7S2RNB5_9STRA